MNMLPDINMIIKATITGEFRDKMTALKDSVRAEIGYDRTPAEVAEAVARARDGLRELEYQAGHEVEGLRPPARDIEELASVKEEFDEYEKQIAFICHEQCAPSNRLPQE